MISGEQTCAAILLRAARAFAAMFGGIAPNIGNANFSATQSVKADLKPSGIV